MTRIGSATTSPAPRTSTPNARVAPQIARRPVSRMGPTGLPSRSQARASETMPMPTRAPPSTLGKYPGPIRSVVPRPYPRAMTMALAPKAT